MARAWRLASVRNAGGPILVSTSIVARDAGSVIRGRSIKSSIMRLPSCEDALVFAAHVFIRRTRGPFDPQMPEVVESGGDGSAALPHSCVQIRPQAGDRSTFDGRRHAGREHIQPLLRGHLRAGEELAFSPLQLYLKDQVVPALP